MSGVKVCERQRGASTYLSYPFFWPNKPLFTERLIFLTVVKCGSLFQLSRPFHWPFYCFSVPEYRAHAVLPGCHCVVCFDASYTRFRPFATCSPFKSICITIVMPVFVVKLGEKAASIKASDAPWSYFTSHFGFKCVHVCMLFVHVRTIIVQRCNIFQRDHMQIPSAKHQRMRWSL